MDPAPPSAPRTCPKHGVVRDPFGHCVICRREDAEPEADPVGAQKALTALMLLAVAVGCVLLYKGMTSVREQPVVHVATSSASPPTQAEAIAEPSNAEVRAAVEVREQAERRAAIDKRVHQIPIQIYTTPWCELCKTATAFMKTRGYAFTELDVEASPAALAALHQKNPKNNVPTIVIGDEVIVGFGQAVVANTLYRLAEKQVH